MRRNAAWGIGLGIWALWVSSGCAWDEGKIGSKVRLLDRLRVEGNHFTDSQGRSVVLKGLNLGYPEVLRGQGRWNGDYFREAASWGCRLIRLPIDPGTYRRLGKDECLALVGQALDWCRKYGMYLMVDWHTCGNPASGVFQEPWEESFRTTFPEMKEFWAAMAERFKNEPTMAFYEIFNEPVAMEWRGGSLTWPQWRDMADEVIDAIYAHNPKAIPVVGGLNWAYDLGGAGKEPLRHKGVAYACHPYPGRVAQPWEQNWERDFGFLAKDHPVMLTEFGFDPDDKTCPAVYKAGTDYGKRILDFAKARGMSWTAFIFYNGAGWPMPLFKDWDHFTPTESGAFFKERLESPD